VVAWRWQTTRVSPAPSRAQRGEAVSVQAHVGRDCPMAQDALACKRLFLDWQSADDTATLHAFYTTTPGEVQQPEGVFENKKT